MAAYRDGGLIAVEQPATSVLTYWLADYGLQTAQQTIGKSKCC